MYNRGITDSKPIIAFLSTYPPRECGIATFTQDLLASTQKFLGKLADCRVAALNLTPVDTFKYPSEVEWRIDQNNKDDFLSLATTINNNPNITGVIIQHEYGIFGGEEGENLLIFMQHCKKNMLVTLHTILPEPSTKMKEVTARIIQYSQSVVVLTENSKKIIQTLYPETNHKVFVIPHGIHNVELSEPKKYKHKLKLNHHIVLSTFGLLSRGKGIEHVLHALPPVIKKYPTILYLILGETHPVIRRNEGEKYRAELASLVTNLGLSSHVRFYDQYFSLPDLFEFLRATDIYISPSINPNQAVSGTLSYALGTGRAVISTEFAQAKEIITPENGRLVPILDSNAISDALLDLLSNEERLKQMYKNAYEKTRPMLWSNVASLYVKLLARLIVPPFKLTHMENMTDDFGMFQFANLTIPNKDSGYTLDDNARALIVSSWLLKINSTKNIEKLARTYIAFIKSCQLPDGSFTNYLGFPDRLPTKQNSLEDTEDSQTRAIWALCEVITNQDMPRTLRQNATQMFLLYFKNDTPLSHLRSKALAIKSFALVLPFLPREEKNLRSKIQKYADSLVETLSRHSIKSWRWFESDLNYNNAVLSEGLLIAGDVLKNKDLTDLGLSSLEFLISKTFSKSHYIPIGHSKWYKNKEKRSSYDQQPEDPASMILALVRAHSLTHDPKYRKLANTCFSWFLGNNSLKKSLYDESTGGCYDGLHPDRVNLNQGAESCVSYLMSCIMILRLQLNEN